MHAIEKIVKTVRRGDSVTEGELTMIPLLNDAAGKAKYLTLEEAVKRREDCQNEVRLWG